MFKDLSFKHSTSYIFSRLTLYALIPRIQQNSQIYIIKFNLSKAMKAASLIVKL